MLPKYSVRRHFQLDDHSVQRDPGDSIAIIFWRLTDLWDFIKNFWYVFQTYFIMNVRRIISTLTLKHLLVCDYHKKSLSRVLADFKCEPVAPSIAWMFTLTPKYTFHPHPKCNQCWGWMWRWRCSWCIGRQAAQTNPEWGWSALYNRTRCFTVVSFT